MYSRRVVGSPRVYSKFSPRQSNRETKLKKWDTSIFLLSKMGPVILIHDFEPCTPPLNAMVRDKSLLQSSKMIFLDLSTEWISFGNKDVILPDDTNFVFTRFASNYTRK